MTRHMVNPVHAEPRRRRPRAQTTLRGLARTRPTDAFRYELVIDLVTRLIEEGGLQQGDKIPTNNELAAMAGVSLISVRRALDEMERDGRVRRHQGLGTFVAAAPILTDSLRVGDLHATLVGEQSEMEISTELLSVGLALPSATIAGLLQIPEEARVWDVRRLRRIEDRASVLEEAVVPVALAEDLDVEALKAGASLYGLLATKHRLVDASEEQFLGFATATTPECRARPSSARSRRPFARSELHDRGHSVRLLPPRLPGDGVRLLHVEHADEVRLVPGRRDRLGCAPDL